MQGEVKGSTQWIQTKGRCECARRARRAPLPSMSLLLAAKERGVFCMHASVSGEFSGQRRYWSVNAAAMHGYRSRREIEGQSLAVAQAGGGCCALRTGGRGGAQERRRGQASRKHTDSRRRDWREATTSSRPQSQPSRQRQMGIWADSNPCRQPSRKSCS